MRWLAIVAATLAAVTLTAAVDVRAAADPTQPPDPNYCPPDVVFTAQVRLTEVVFTCALSSGHSAWSTSFDTTTVYPITSQYPGCASLINATPSPTPTSSDSSLTTFWGPSPRSSTAAPTQSSDSTTATATVTVSDQNTATATDGTTSTVSATTPLTGSTSTSTSSSEATSLGTTTDSPVGPPGGATSPLSTATGTGAPGIGASGTGASGTGAPGSTGTAGATETTSTGTAGATETTSTGTAGATETGTGGSDTVAPTSTSDPGTTTQTDLTPNPTAVPTGGSTTVPTTGTPLVLTSTGTGVAPSIAKSSSSNGPVDTASTSQLGTSGAPPASSASTTTATDTIIPILSTSTSVISGTTITTAFTSVSGSVSVTLTSVLTPGDTIGTPSQTTGISTSTSSAPTSSASGNSSTPLIPAPLFKARLGNSDYFMPTNCSRPGQQLWAPDGTRFTLYCDRVQFENGTVCNMQNMDDANPGECASFCSDPSTGYKMCFVKRFDTQGGPNGTIIPWCFPHGVGSRGLATRATPGLPDIASRLSDLQNNGCSASNYFSAVAVYYFQMAMKDVNAITAAIDFIINFFKIIAGDIGNLLTFIIGGNGASGWIDRVDQAFLDLSCWVGPQDQGTAIWRSLTQHYRLHEGINAVLSIQDVAQVNVILQIIELVLKSVITDLRNEYLTYIGSYGQIIQAWTQSTRLCTTKWDLDNLEHPEEEGQDEEDEDDWLPRYWIETKPGTSVAELRIVEATLGTIVGGVPADNPQGPWEMNTQKWNANIPPKYLVDLNAQQAEMVSLAVGYLAAVGKILNSRQEKETNGANIDWHMYRPDLMGKLLTKRQREGIENRTRMFEARSKMFEARSKMFEARSKMFEAQSYSNESASFHSRPIDMPDTQPRETRTTPDMPPELRQKIERAAQHVKRVWGVPIADAQTTGRPRTIPTHLKMISSAKGMNPQSKRTYEYYSEEGRGGWLFIVDDGFNWDRFNLPRGADDQDRQELSTTYREIRTYVVPDQYTQPNDPPIPPHHPPPDTIDDTLVQDHRGFAGHGTGVACMAGGVNRGVGSQANLYLIKVLTFYGLPQPGSSTQVLVQAARRAIEHAFGYMYNVMTDPNSGIDPTKTVINLNWGFAHIDTQNPRSAGQQDDLAWWEQTWRTWTAAFDALGVTFVVPVANSGWDPDREAIQHYMAEEAPECWVSDADPVITVAGVFSDGSLSEYNAPPGNRPGAPHSDVKPTLYAVSEDLETCSADGTIRLVDGNSFAAPQVAGLAVSLLTYPWPPQDNPFNLNDGHPVSIGSRMKTLLFSWSYQRIPDAYLTWQAQQRLGNDPFPYVVSSPVNVVYNYAHGEQRCRNVPGYPINVKRDRLADSCPVAPFPGMTSTATESYSWPDEATASASDGSGTATATATTNSTTSSLPTVAATATTNSTTTTTTTDSTTTTTTTTTTDSTTTTTTDPMTTTTTSLPTATGGISCPQSNDTIYLDADDSKQYLVECFIDLPGNDIVGQAGFQTDYEHCAQHCSNTAGCVAFAYVPTNQLGAQNCFPKSALGNSVPASGDAAQNAAQIKTGVGVGSAGPKATSTA